MEARPGDLFKFVWVAGCFILASCRLVRGLKLRRSAGHPFPLEDAGERTEVQQTFSGDLLYLWLALGFTVAADSCMVLGREDTKGLYCFLAVQLLYFVRLGQRPVRLLVQAAVAAGAVMLCAALGIEPEAEVTAGICYITLFAGNLAAAVRRMAAERLSRREKWFVWGLILFFLCDIHVGIMNLGEYMDLPAVYWQRILPYSQRALWVFYLPSQLLIACSDWDRLSGTASRPGRRNMQKE